MSGLPRWLSGKEFTCQTEDQIGSLGQEDLLENEMDPHSSILAWEIPWTEEAGRLQSLGSPRVGTQLNYYKQQQQDYVKAMSCFIVINVKNLTFCNKIFW